MTFELIVKYLKGEASLDEKKAVLSWIDKSAENKEEFANWKRIWALTEKASENEDIAYRNFQKFAKREKQISRFRKIMAQAAVFILLIGVGGALSYLYLNSNSKQQVYQAKYTVKSPLGQMTELKLPDGTFVLLNSGSEIKYNADFSRGRREVFLEGQAFFDVEKDKKHPFLVKSQAMDIKVYGTSFNVEVYPDDEIFNTTLVEGSISVLDKEGKEIALLKPGENASLTKNENKLLVQKVNTAIYTSWKEGLVTFRNEKMKDIAKLIERWYNVEIIIRNEELGDEKYFGTILKNKPIDQILEVFKLTTAFEYEIVPRANKPTLIYWDKIN
ncbi:DUF4974 domain-containing protein [Maribellus comscasis]|uniref:DUF4974 domain-containing protein n=1 Tax=Maribellus comscasis TaxID=2681766 RepID=A0A6I6JUL6_9BACT|nr:FecR domain-containing protein [Maribellus comscasis]QGY44770.1 DUF4974 domain-containing protein [Maribellus comscasis]